MTNPVTVNAQNDRYGHLIFSLDLGLLVANLGVAGLFQGGLMTQRLVAPTLYGLAMRAALTGESLDQLVVTSMARMRCANSSGSVAHLPRMMKSSVTPNLSTSSTANGSVIPRLPFSNRDQ